MSTLASFFFPQQPLLPPRQRPSTFFLSRPRLPAISSSESRSIKSVTASASSFDELHAKGKPRPKPAKNSVLSNLIQEIEPLDVSIIQKGVPADTIDAMKRTISGMLGLLPSDQFHVIVEAFWDPLSKLLVSSMMTGYTLRNAEYRLCLERNLDIHEEPFENRKTESSERNGHEMLLDSTTAMLKLSGRNDLLPKSEESEEEPYLEDVGLQGLGEITPEVQDYVLYLQSRLSSVKKELHNTKRKNSALQMQHFVGEEKNDLLDYLRSLHPEKVAELSEPTCPESKETIHSVVHGLLATLSSKMHSKTPQAENATTGNPEFGNDDSSELMENTSLHFQPLISVSRDYLARLLFWCMLLGHYLRGLEYRLELMRLLTLSGTESPAPNGDQSA